MTAPSGYEQWAHLYDLFDRRETAGFYLPYVKDAKEVLEIGCGTGRVAIPLAERGVHVYCVEPSPAMRRAFASNLSRQPDLIHRITLARGDAESFDFDRAFPAAIMGGVFDHFPGDEERIAALHNVYRHLEPGGRLLFDVGLDYRPTEGGPEPMGEATVDGRTYRRFQRIRALPEGRVEFTTIFEIDEEGKVVDRLEETCVGGAVDRPLLHEILRRTGFVVSAEFRDFERNPHRAGDPLLVVEAVRI